ncbi:MAG TPA: tRNA dihydrouridine synthase DusB, partial [Rhodospirillaceae bacterium]|nr:tRNA dihydrouridine synthase DusB [Rhodospirillaceae bacterium]
QLAGHDPAIMAEAARLCTDLGADIIDLNFGCPAKKVTRKLCGSALMRDLDQALAIVEAVVAAVDAPVTIK